MKVFSTLILILFLSHPIFSQTSNEEYLYTTYGYKEQLLKGLDDKKGYHWKPLTEFSFTHQAGKLVWKKSSQSKFEFEGLYRVGEYAPCSIVAIYKEQAHLPKKDGVFICLPHPNSSGEIMTKATQYFEEEIEFDKHLLNYYSQGLSKLAMVIAQVQ